MKTVTVDIMENGEIRFIEKPGTETLSDLGESTRRRISRVEPKNPLARLAFYTIRRIASDGSAPSNWTRTWGCIWRVRMLKSGVIFGEFTDRMEAIEAEVKYWNEVESKE